MLKDKLLTTLHILFFILFGQMWLIASYFAPPEKHTAIMITAVLWLSISIVVATVSSILDYIYYKKLEALAEDMAELMRRMPPPPIEKEDGKGRS